MKKTLVALVFAATAALSTSGFCGPLELNKRLTDGKELSYSQYREGSRLGETNINVRNEYNVQVNASACPLAERNTKRNMIFHIADSNTEVGIFDHGADGMSNGDYMTIDHKLKNNDILHIEMEYLGNEEYRVESHITGKIKVEPLSADMSKSNPLIKFIVRQKTKPIIELGHELYQDLTEVIISGKEPAFPYQKIGEIMSGIDSCLEENQGKKNCLGSALLKLGEKYLKLADNIKKAREINNQYAYNRRASVQ